MNNRINQFLEEEEKQLGLDWYPETAEEFETISNKCNELMREVFEAHNYKPQNIFDDAMFKTICHVIVNQSILISEVTETPFLQAMSTAMSIVVVLTVNDLITTANFKKQS